MSGGYIQTALGFFLLFLFLLLVLLLSLLLLVAMDDRLVGFLSRLSLPMLLHLLFVCDLRGLSLVGVGSYLLELIDPFCQRRFGEIVNDRNRLYHIASPAYIANFSRTKFRNLVTALV